MTVVNQNEHEQPQPPQSTVGRADLARTDAHRVAALVQIARDSHGEARDSGEDAERFQKASFALYDRIASKPGDRRTRLDRALHGIDGSLDEEAVLEYLDLTGREGFTARQALQRILDRRMFPEFDGGQEISDRLHGLAYRWERDDRTPEATAGTRPALPPAGAAPVAQVPLQRREPIRPSQPPLYPPAPEEAPGWATNQSIEVLKEATAHGAGQALNGQSLQALHDSGFGQRPTQAPDFGPAPDPSFGAASLPQASPVRAGDTQRLAPVPAADRAGEVLADLAMDDASASGPEERVVPPFAEAAGRPAESSRPAAASRNGGDKVLQWC